MVTGTFIGTEALWDMVCWWTRITSTGPQSVPLCPRMVSKCHFSGIISTGFLEKEKQEYNAQWCNRCFKVLLKEEITLLPKLGIIWSLRNGKRNVQARFELAKKVLDLNHVGETYDTGFSRVLWSYICLVPVLSLKHEEQSRRENTIGWCTWFAVEESFTFALLTCLLSGFPWPAREHLSSTAKAFRQS